MPLYKFELTESHRLTLKRRSDLIMVVQFQNRKIPEECHQKMREFFTAGDDIIWVAFPSGGGDNRWSILTKSGQFFNRNIPEECHQQMKEYSKDGAKLIRVAFTPGGGWSIINDRGAYFNRNIPDECHQKMGEYSKDGAKLISVAFPPQGGNSWSIVNDKGAFFNRNIPDECHQKMTEYSRGGAKITCVAFPPQGGNSWSIVNDRGAFFNRNIDDEAHMILGYFTEVYGPVQFVVFDTDGSGWSVGALVNKNEKICDATQCVSILDVYRNVQTALEGNVVGYACAVGSGSLGAYSYGQARTQANAPAKMFLPSTKIPVASVSKAVTTLAAIPLLAKHSVSLDSSIGGYLPGDWTLDSNVSSITFRQLLSHRSGIKDYGNNDQTYDTLKRFFTQKVDTTKNTMCQPASVVNPPDPINPNSKGSCYSNYNFSIFRVLLPIIDGFSDFSGDVAVKLANAYVKIVQRFVFEPVGAQGVDAKPPASGPQANSYAFAYKYPGTASGWDWGDNTLGVGSAGWWLAIDDISKVLYSLNKDDGRILTHEQLNDMVTTPLGWDVSTKSGGTRWIEKNGGWSANGTTISTSIALFGAGVFGALFLNSDILGPGLQNNWQWCKNCQGLSFAGNANLGPCPAGALHDHTGSNNFRIHYGSGPSGTQGKWRWCKKCEMLSFGGNTSIGQCSGGGDHDHGGSGEYFLAQRGSGGVPRNNQDNWRWCSKCQGLAFAGGSSAGACAAGGQHDHVGSGNYLLERYFGADAVLYGAYVDALKPK